MNFRGTRLGWLLFLAMLAAPLQAAVDITGVRMWPAPENTRLVFDLAGSIEHTLFTLKSPDRIVVDLKNVNFRGELPRFDFSSSNVRQVRFARRSNNTLRFVFDLRRQVNPKSFVLKPHGNYGHRLVIDLYNADRRPTKQIPKKIDSKPGKARDIIIAIDAGHGGEDPGASGRRGTKEKTVVLGVARELEKLIRKEPGMRPLMIRTGDYYIGLRQRVKKARRGKADLFVSIHADAFNKRSARGSSVFVLSDRGASSEAARFLAESENNADLIGGVSLDDKDDLLKMVLVDMVKNSTMADSHDVAARVLKNLGRVNKLHKRRVEQAGFRVLKSTGMPSILVETAFISNPAEERQLRSKKHQKKMARAILDGIRGYFRANPPVGTRLAAAPRKHVVSRGDTLSGIASRYQVSVRSLRKQNGLRSDRLPVGKVLQIPYSS